MLSDSFISRKEQELVRGYLSNERYESDQLRSCLRSLKVERCPKSDRYRLSLRGKRLKLTDFELDLIVG